MTSGQAVNENNARVQRVHGGSMGKDSNFRMLPAGVTAAAMVALVGLGSTAWAADGDGDEYRRPDRRRATVEVVASGLDNPRGMAVGPDGALYVAEAGRGGDGPCVRSNEPRDVCYGSTGAITRISGGGADRVITGLPSLAPAPGQPAAGTGATGVHDLVFDARGRGTAVIGLGVNPTLTFENDAFRFVRRRFGRVLNFRIYGAASLADDLAGYEAEKNPDGGLFDTNPYGVTVVPGGVAVADAGANAVVQVASDGTITTLGVLPAKIVPAPVPGGMVPMQAVPTSVAVGPDGAVYVGQLTGFPFPVGGASVWKVEPGSAPTEYATGFTNIVDLKFDRDGVLYVLQLTTTGLLTGNPLGALLRVETDGSHTEIAPGALISPGGFAFGRDGSIYVSRFATLAGAGDVVRIRQ
jgi:hypothetical protein